MSAPHPAAADHAALIDRAASNGPEGLMPAASDDSWALLSRAESDADAADGVAGPLPAELQKKALAWLDPAGTQPGASMQSQHKWQGPIPATNSPTAAADYLQAQASLGELPPLRFEPLPQRSTECTSA